VADGRRPLVAANQKHASANLLPSQARQRPGIPAAGIANQPVAKPPRYRNCALEEGGGAKSPAAFFLTVG